ncbi:uncharacterized protein isoform X2 [Rhodnius prolixus]|uniref:uncharacterized protein isoform X2 n=1 Tax=Rhodnius prolixus TaxID=13249 RepID=UPI003D18EC19
MLKSAIKVYARIKPIIDSNAVKHSYKIQHGSGKNDKEYLVINSTPDDVPSKYFAFKFNKVFTEQTSQSEFYERVGKPVVERLLIGYNGAIFAFGQTGTGKTHSIIGGLRDAGSVGIIPRVFVDVFNFIKSNPKRVCTLYISALEIYNELCYDLTNLVETNDQEDEVSNFNRVYIMEDADGTIRTMNLGKHKVLNMDDVMKYLRISMNNRSERSKKKEGPVLLLNEAKYINLSLHYLQQVIVALKDSNRHHIPYRNSMLTSLLRDSLGGNCCTVMVFTISLERKNFNETITTCKFAQRVSLIENEPRVIVEYDANQQLSLLKEKAVRLSSLTLNKKEDIVVEKKKSVCEKAAQCNISLVSNEGGRYLTTNSEYVNQTVHHINRGIKLLSTLLKEIPSLRLIQESTNKRQDFSQTFTTILGLELPTNNYFSGELYTKEQRLAYRDFIKLASTNEALMRHLELNILYYKQLEHEWRLWNHERILIEKISKLEAKRRTALSCGEFPDIIQNLSENYNFCVQHYNRIRQKGKEVQESRRIKMNLFMEARKKLLGAFEIWWQRQNNRRNGDEQLLFKCEQEQKHSSNNFVPETGEKSRKGATSKSYYPLHSKSTSPTNYCPVLKYMNSDFSFAPKIVESPKKSSATPLKLPSTMRPDTDQDNSSIIFEHKMFKSNIPADTEKNSPLFHKNLPLNSGILDKNFSDILMTNFSLSNNEMKDYAQFATSNEQNQDSSAPIFPKSKFKTTGTLFHSLFGYNGDEDKNIVEPVKSSINLKLTGDSDLDSRILEFYRQQQFLSLH